VVADLHFCSAVAVGSGHANAIDQAKSRAIQLVGTLYCAPTGLAGRLINTLNPSVPSFLIEETEWQVMQEASPFCSPDTDYVHYAESTSAKCYKQKGSPSVVIAIGTSIRSAVLPFAARLLIADLAVHRRQHGVRAEY
jgi:hypothetical protein